MALSVGGVTAPAIVVPWALSPAPVSSSGHQQEGPQQIYYLNKYFDKHYKYRHVMVPRELSEQ